MGLRIRFLDRNGDSIKEIRSKARTAQAALEAVTAFDWPPGAIRLIICDPDGIPILEKLRRA